jgi:hypothetical protein
MNTYKAITHERGSDNSWRNGVHANAVGAKEVGHAAGNAENTGYG